MPALQNTIAWAAPVKVEVFGAHLEAYSTCLPIINTLRLCHRYGKGTSVAKLPVELIICIEEALIAAERKPRLKAWRQEYKCYQNRCVPKDHYGSARLQEWRRMIRLDTARCDALDENDIEERLNDFIEDHTGHRDIHFERDYSWNDRLDLESSCLQDRSFLVTHFGLELWLSSARLNGISATNPYVAEESTLAYLMLPGRSTRDREWALSKREVQSDDWYFESGCAMDIVTDLRLPRSGVSRFNRCFEMLGVKPCVPNSQKQSALGPNGVSDHKQKRMSRKWPRLMVLSRVQASTGD